MESFFEGQKKSLKDISRSFDEQGITLKTSPKNSLKNRWKKRCVYEKGNKVFESSKFTIIDFAIAEKWKWPLIWIVRWPIGAKNFPDSMFLW